MYMCMFQCVHGNVHMHVMCVVLHPCMRKCAHMQMFDFRFFVLLF